MSGGKMENEELTIDASMTMGQFLDKVVIALIRNGQEDSVMEVNSRINGQVGPVEVTVSVAKHPAAMLNSRAAKALFLKQFKTDGSKAGGFNTVGAHFESYATTVMPKGVSSAQRIETKRAFYAGAQAVLELMLQVAADDVSDDAGMHILDGLHQECGIFASEVAAGRA